MDRDIIDLRDYLEGRDEDGRGVFALWGAEGERSRLALPVWRAIFLAGGERGGVLCTAPEGDLEPFFVLDLAVEPARTEFPGALTRDLATGEPPRLREAEGVGVAVFLGRGEEGEAWFLVVESRELGALGRGAREELLFLAGECGGLLFHRDLARER